MFARLMGLKTISPARLHELMQTGSAIAIDVNPRESWIAARVPGARHLDPLSYGQGELPPGKDAPLVFYCSNPLCRKAPNAARRAEAMGYTNVHVMSAGIRGWRRASLPTECGDPPPG